PWPQLVQERIFQPVGMTSGYVQDLMQVMPGRAHGYAFSGKSYQNAEALRPGAAYSAGAIICQSSDLAKYGDAVMREKFVSHAELWKP
ncbi:serine hydrolase, partial [Acinetobacter baumannii]